jgi:hypothetical protein
MFLDLVYCFWILMCLSKVLEKVTKEGEKKRERVGCVQPTPARPGTPDCPVVHRTVSGARGWLMVNQLLSGIDGVVRLKFTGLSGGAPDCPVSHPRRTRRSRETEKVTWLKFIGLSGEPTVASANVWPRNLRAIHGLLQRSAGAPDSVRCANGPGGETVGCAWFGRRSCTGHEQWLSTRQKAGIAFQDCLQWLLAVLGL